MSETTTQTITLDDVQAVIAEHGFEITSVDTEDNAIRVRDLESGISLTLVLETDVLYLTVSLLTVKDTAITPAVMRTMLDAGNGITTSAFQLFHLQDGETTVTLNNFCKLMNLGTEDQDDVFSCIEFLIFDAMEARNLLSDLADHAI